MMKSARSSGGRFDMTEHYRRTLPRPPLAWCGIFKKL
jgi:hypothetical protein